MYLRRAFGSALLGIALVASVRAADVTTLEGKKTVGDPTAFNLKEVTLKDGVKLELSKLSAIDYAAVKEDVPNAKWIEAELLDGSKLRLTDFALRGKNAVLTLYATTGTGPVVEIPAAMVFYICRDAQDAKVSQRFREILSKRGKRDVWVIQKGETLDGVTGTFLDADAQGTSVQFEMEATGMKVPINVKRIYGVILNQPPGAEMPQTLCRVVDVGKNVWFAQSLEITDTNNFVITAVTGAKVTYPVSGISKLDFSAGAMRYLSDLDPTKAEESSTARFPEHYRRDRNLDNEPLRLEGVPLPYSKGLSMRAGIALTYDIERKYKVFEAFAGVDPSREADSAGTLTIEADGKQVFREMIRKADKPRTISLNVTGVRSLSVRFESDSPFDLHQQVTLADAKVRK